MFLKLKMEIDLGSKLESFLLLEKILSVNACSFLYRGDFLFLPLILSTVLKEKSTPFKREF